MCGEVSGRKPADWTLDRASTPAARRAPRCCLFLAFKKLPALERGEPVPQNKPGPQTRRTERQLTARGVPSPLPHHQPLHHGLGQGKAAEIKAPASKRKPRDQNSPTAADPPPTGASCPSSPLLPGARVACPRSAWNPGHLLPIPPRARVISLPPRPGPRLPAPVPPGTRVACLPSRPGPGSPASRPSRGPGRLPPVPPGAWVACPPSRPEPRSPASHPTRGPGHLPPALAGARVACPCSLTRAGAIPVYSRLPSSWGNWRRAWSGQSGRREQGSADHRGTDPGDR